MSITLREIIIQDIIVLFIFIFAIIKKKLTFVGACYALIIGFSIAFSGFEYMILLCSFFGSSIGLTSAFKSIKMKHLGKTYLTDKTRGGYQVFCKGFFPTFISLLIFYKYKGELNLYDTNLSNEQKFLYGMYIGFFVSANSDTWASEIGINSKEQPFLITKCRRVPKGINGGISILGTLASFLGGIFIAFTGLFGSFIRNYNSLIQSKELVINKSIIILIIGAFCGGLGSFLDSLMGCTIQLSVYDTEKKCIVDKEEFYKSSNKGIYKVYGFDILNNSLVNLFTGIIISFISGYFYMKFL